MPFQITQLIPSDAVVRIISQTNIENSDGSLEFAMTTSQTPTSPSTGTIINYNSFFNDNNIYEGAYFDGNENNPDSVPVTGQSLTTRLISGLSIEPEYGSSPYGIGTFSVVGSVNLSSGSQIGIGSLVPVGTILNAPLDDIEAAYPDDAYIIIDVQEPGPPGPPGPTGQTGPEGVPADSSVIRSMAVAIEDLSISLMTGYNNLRETTKRNTVLEVQLAIIRERNIAEERERAMLAKICELEQCCDQSSSCTTSSSSCDTTSTSCTTSSTSCTTSSTSCTTSSSCDTTSTSCDSSSTSCTTSSSCESSSTCDDESSCSTSVYSSCSRSTNDCGNVCCDELKLCLVKSTENLITAERLLAYEIKSGGTHKRIADFKAQIKYWQHEISKIKKTIDINC